MQLDGAVASASTTVHRFTFAASAGTHPAPNTPSDASPQARR